MQEGKSNSWLVWLLRGGLIILFLLLEGRLIELQLIKGAYYRHLAEGNRIKRVTLPALRGKIIARGGELVVGNQNTTRDYLLGSMASHLTGYLGETNADEVGRVDSECITKGIRTLRGKVGRTGLEEAYNCSLAGVDGEVMVEVNTKGEEVRRLGQKNPVPGKDLKTNLDYSLQQAVAKAMSGKLGGVIATDAKGEVLALYSSPSFDPRKVEAYFNDPDQPLFNRVISGLYHPGSVFKPLIALAGLSQGVITRDDLYNDIGYILVESLYGKFTYSNWFFTQYGKTEGQLNIVKALGRSTDTFFYHLGELLGVEAIVDWTGRLGLDRTIDLDLPGGVAGFVPSPLWKERTKGEKWFLGNTYHLAIGQGDLALTPAHIQTLTLTIASGGRRCGLRVVGQPPCTDLDFNHQAVAIITEGMVKACLPGGTGSPFFNYRLPVACKTGTAETGDGQTSHAWFSVFAPVANPEIVLTVLVEKGGEGSSVAGPIAKEILDAWFTKKV